MRVLIVDDHPIVISGCRALLESDPGVEVFEASDSEAGYSAYFARIPDIAIVDLNLPGLSGLEWFAAFCNASRRPRSSYSA